MPTNLPPLTMAASIEVDGSEVWYAMPLAEVVARGLERHVRDTLDANHCHVVLDLSEIDDAPRCAHCSKATTSLFYVDDDVYMCGPCERTTRSPDDGWTVPRAAYR